MIRFMETPFFSPQGNQPMNTMQPSTEPNRVATRSVSSFSASSFSNKTLLQSLAAHIRALRTSFGRRAVYPHGRLLVSGAIFPSSPRSRWTFLAAVSHPVAARLNAGAAFRPEMQR
jgi:hypothetical protein